ncbi:hypothetical protein [Acutalibacter caecimuris]|uniref:hypothetical protein n=1 Tax=Acutalibacter caecimuris TaxID=3093657 RepID=UPI002AC8C7B1|nr:hypothetical protein [Acutalibacter sp. M00118]
MFYHASQTHCIEVLEPRISQHERPLVYFSKKRENVLAYLSNAIEKYCHETGFPYEPPYRKWASYGFHNGLARLDEYYPNALEDTYRGVSGYIYAVETVPGGETQADIPDAVVTGQPVPVSGCEFVPDAYEAILEAEEAGLILIRRYADLPESMLTWLDGCIKQQYMAAREIPTYRHFLEGKFPEIIGGLE